MWYSLARFILKFKVFLLVLLALATAFMGFEASKVQLSYEPSRAIPKNNQKYIEYQQFRKKFGDDGNTLVIGIASDKIFTPAVFNAFANLDQRLKKIPGVVDILSAPDAVDFIKDSASGRLITKRIFNYPYSSQAQLDSDKAVFKSLPFYKGLLYARDTAWLMAVRLNKDTVQSKSRTRLVSDIVREANAFKTETNIPVHVSGLPYYLTNFATRIAHEMNWFLTGSLLLSAITLLLFFRSINATIMSLLVVGMGVVFSLGTMVLLGYRITLLTAIIPPLIVVIGIPNCIYFLNKYHTAYKDTNDKNQALITMVGRMGVVTLFCNIAAAIGFSVFAFTHSDILKEFGIVSGINIMMLFIISLIFIPPVLSFMPPPKKRHVKYLDNKLLEKLLARLENWAFNHGRLICGVTVVAVAISVAGMMRLKKEGFIMDDLQKKDIVYTDLKWFESNFGGVMPLEVVIDTRKKKGLLKLPVINKIDSFTQYILTRPEASKPLSYVEGLKFAIQAFYGGDSAQYRVPTEFEGAFMGSLLRSGPKDSTKQNQLNNLLGGFIDSNKQVARINVNIQDLGTAKLPGFINSFDSVSKTLFDTAHYNVTFTGGSVTFLEGSSFIIDGLKSSICWAFLLIAICMLYLFRSVRILLCSLIPNVVPLIITAGLMGWMGVSLKPSTVLVFSVALGIAIDVTIRFLVNYKQELPHFNYDVPLTLRQTIRHTGTSIIYTSLVLIAGFVIFCFSDFVGTQSLGWLTSLTLIVGTLTNLTLLPVLIKALAKKKKA